MQRSWSRGTASAGPFRRHEGIPALVMVNDVDRMDQPATFQSGQQLRNVEVIVTDKQTDLAFHVTDAQGQLTLEYVALVFSIDKARWFESSRYIQTFRARSTARSAVGRERNGHAGSCTAGHRARIGYWLAPGRVLRRGARRPGIGSGSRSGAARQTDT